MQRLTNFFGVLMLVLFVWTGSSAHAAQRFDCIPASSESTVHFSGDRDEAPAKGDKEVAHHHGGCNGHHIATTADNSASLIFPRRSSGSRGLVERYAPSRGPDEQLRPPIA